MTRVKSFSQGIKEQANPFESSKPLAKSTYHRIHRSKKNRKSFGNSQEVKLYKQKLEHIKEQELDRDIDNFKNLMARKGKWYLK